MNLSKFNAICQLIPGIISTVTSIENAGAFPPQSGPRKLDLALAIINASAQVSPEIAQNLTSKDLNEVSTGIIKSTVFAFNAINLFKTSSVPSPQTPPPVAAQGLLSRLPYTADALPWVRP